MQYRQKEKTHSYHFDNLPELQQYIVDTRQTWSSPYSKTDPATKDWDLCAGYTGALELARSGYVEGAQVATNTLKVFAPVTPRPAYKWGCHGVRPSAARYLTGKPQYWRKRTPDAETGTNRTLTLIVPISLSCAVKAQCASNFGLGIAQYVRMIEAQGKRVQVIAGFKQTSFEGVQLTYTWNVKRADQPLSLASLCFAIGHPAMFRRLGFALMERSNTKEMAGYGVPTDIKTSDVINCPTGAIVLNGINNANKYCQTVQDAAVYIAERIADAMKDRNAGSGWEQPLELLLKSRR